MEPGVLESVLETWRRDFSDLPDVAGITRLVTRLAVAAALGGILGLEREAQGKDAGLRTHMLICVGAALFVLVPQQAGIEGEGLARIIEGVIDGVGFIGGGAILKLSDERLIEGLTTAAGIWLGLAQAAFEFTLEYVGKRHGYLAGASQAGGEIGYRSNEAWAQMAIGKMDHWLGTGRTVLFDTVARLDGPFDDVAHFTRHMARTVYHLRLMSEEVADGAIRTCGAHAYVSGSRLERIYRDMVGSNVMAWKTDQLQHMLGLAALGRDITLAGPAGT